ncbi:RodZ family helix-turn-helix domain-containing protein [Brevundimonas sp. M20]|uniref:helix-turn-helix domain-containing protein n=1 Tax=Brevundimonas sp. M20 TaxID=2591463 RepID=UPI0011469618|nr:hypothetical protein [Brevundimonas sp. M20]QDH74246.1 hypothetical protein FKQ52_12940 [Brevundimonas sp. M20]
MSSLVATPMQLVALPLAPEPQESLAGFLCRVAHWNVIHRPWDFVGGVVRWPPVVLRSEALQQLPISLGVDRAVFDRAFRQSHTPGFGSRMMIWGRRRISPASLRQSPYHRTHWQVRALRFCPESWQILIDQCPACDEYLTWFTRSVDRCQSCDADLQHAEAPYVPEEYRRELSLVAQLVTEPPPAPASIDFGPLTAPELFELIVIAGRCLRPSREVASPMQAVESLLGGLRLIQGFPTSVRELARAKANRAEHSFFRRLACHANYRQGRLKAALQALGSPRPATLGMQRLREARLAQGFMTIRELAAKLRIERADLRRLIDVGVLGERAARGRHRACDWFSSEDAGQVESFLKGRVSATAWARRMSLTVVDVRNLLSAGLLSEPSEMARVAFSGLQLDAEIAVKLESELAALATPVADLSGWIPVKQALRRWGGGYKPWAALLSAALSRYLPGGLALPEGMDLRIGDAWISQEALECLSGEAGSQGRMSVVPPDAFARYRPATLSWGEVEEVLNCYPADVARVLAMGFIRRTGSNDDANFDAASVEEFAVSYVSQLEISALAEIPSRMVGHKLRGTGLERTETGFWRRTGLSEILAALATHPVVPG